MTWAKLDDQFHGHPKLAEIDPDLMLAAAGLYTMTLSWCADQLTDGFVPEIQPRRIAGARVDNLIDELLRVGLWKKCKGGYQVHDYLDYNPSKKQVISERKRKSEAGKRGAKARWQTGIASEVDSTCHGTSHSTCHGTPHQNRTPNRIGSSDAPVPVPILSEGEPAGGSAPVENSKGDQFEDVDFGDEHEPVSKETSAKDLTTTYVREHERVHKTEPSDNHRGHVGKIIKQALAEHKPEVIETATRLLVKKGKDPKVLPKLIEEAAEADRRQPGHGPSLPDMTDQEKKANHEAAKEAHEQVRSLGRKKP